MLLSIFRRRFFVAALLAALLLCAPLWATEQTRAPAAARPNIVIILSDDYGWGSATCYGADPALIQTPHIDRLAAEGRRFTDANTTSSVCSPTRYSLLTGRYCWRTSLKHEVLGTTSPLHIEPGRLNIASLLKRHGYATAAIGKWHLGYGSQPRVDFTKPLRPGPLEIGFDYHFGVPANHGDVSGVYVENDRVYGLRSDKLDPQRTGTNFKDRGFLGLDAPQRVDDEVMPLLTTKAVNWLQQQTKDQPFFLYYTPVAIHNPVTPSPQTKGTSKAGPYGDWIHELDVSVGRLLDTLEKQGLSDNTLVLFTSDNGGVNKPTVPGEATEALQAGLAISGPFRGGKHDVWEGGFRVPYIVRWPGHVPAGTVCDETLSLVDTLATVSALVGDPLPPAARAAEDSYNMLPAWLGRETAGPIRPDLIVHSADGNFAIRRGEWKWIEGDYHPDTRQGALRLRADQFLSQLYNLARDRGETSDLQSADPATAQELRQLLTRYRRGGYSRELPPLPPPEVPVQPLSDAVGKVVRTELLDQVPGEPWVQVRGVWRASEDAVRGSQKRAEPGGAAIRCPLGREQAEIAYQVSLPLATRHVLRIQGSQRERVYLVQIDARRLAVMRQGLPGEPAGNVLLAEAKLQLAAGSWAQVRVQVSNSEIAAQVNGTPVRATHELLEGEKSAIALMAFGQNVGFRQLTVRDQVPR